MQDIQQVDYIRIQDACGLAGVSRQWLLRLVKAGGVPGAAVVAGYHLFDRAAFAPWAAEQRAKRKRPRVNRP